MARRRGVGGGGGGASSGGSGGGSGGKINVTPLIDVVMCLIVFYLIVAKLASDRMLPVDLPEARQGMSDEAQRPIIISVGPSPEGVSIEVQGKAIVGNDEARLAFVRVAVESLTKERPDAPVHLRADRALEYARVRPVVEACRQAGVKSLLLVASRDDAPTRTPTDGGTP
jgi:biopolymer transport protein ExbD